MNLHIALEAADVDALDAAVEAAEAAGVAFVTIADHPVHSGAAIEAGVRAA